MNVLNRVFIVLLLLAAMVVCSVALVTPGPVLNTIAQQAQAASNTIATMPTYLQLGLGIVAALVLDLLFLLLLVLELRRPARKSIRVEKVEGGEVMVEVKSIADRLRYEVDQLPSVLRVRPHVSGKKRGVLVELDVEVAADGTVPEMAGEIIETAKQVIEEGMGLKVTRTPKVNLRVVNRPKVRRKQPPVTEPEQPEPQEVEEPTEVHRLPSEVDESE